MKIAFQTRLRAVIGLFFSISGILLSLIAEVFTFIDDTYILLSVLGLLFNFIALCFYFADAFRCNKPTTKLSKILNDIVLLILTVGSVPTYITLGFSSGIAFAIAYSVYSISIPALVIFSVVYEVKRYYNN